MVPVWRFMTVILASLSMAMAFAHLLEMPPRLEWDARMWIATTVEGNVFRLFGTIGAAIETLAWIAALVLAYLVRHHRKLSFYSTLAGATLLLAAFVVWWMFVFPVNSEMAGWTIGTFPENWSEWRTQWEYAHAARAALLIAGFGALVLSVVADPQPSKVMPHTM